MTSLGFVTAFTSFTSFSAHIKYLKVSNKLTRKRNHYKNIKYRNYIKRVIRSWQKLHNGRLPDLSVIPKGSYCDKCPYYYSFEVGEDDIHVGLVAIGQTHIGGCRLINKTDDDLGGWGMLWDSIKECPF